MDCLDRWGQADASAVTWPKPKDWRGVSILRPSGSTHTLHFNINFHTQMDTLAILRTLFVTATITCTPGHFNCKYCEILETGKICMYSFLPNFKIRIYIYIVSSCTILPYSILFYLFYLLILLLISWIFFHSNWASLHFTACFTLYLCSCDK